MLQIHGNGEMADFCFKMFKYFEKNTILPLQWPAQQSDDVGEPFHKPSVTLMMLNKPSCYFSSVL